MDTLQADYLCGSRYPLSVGKEQTCGRGRIPTLPVRSGSEFLIAVGANKVKSSAKLEFFIIADIVCWRSLLLS